MPAPTDPATFAGTTRFQVVRLLGEGGMGIVYEVIDRELDAHVALKTLRQVDPEALYRFKQEFRTVQDVEHPNLVRLGELIEEGGRWFFTMELVDGQDLMSFVRPGEPPRVATSAEPTRALPVGSSSGRRLVHPSDEPTGATVATARPRLRSIGDEPVEATPAPGPRRFSEPHLRDAFAQLAEGLHRLHGARVVHRDVKPSNVLVDASGRVVLLDFGIATEVASVADPSLLAMGTLAFMAPEQGEGGEPQPASDWYAVGVTLYQALTGALPHRGQTPEQLHASKLHATPRAPRELCADVPEDLEALCLALLRPDPAARPGGAELARRLRQHAGPSSPRRRRATVQSTFLGREAELAELVRALEDSRRGTVAVVVTGDSGIGKSALVRRFREVVLDEHPEALVLAGRCHERESVPYKAIDGVIDALSRHLATLPAAELDALLPASIGALAQVFPVLGQLEAVARRDGAAPAPERAEVRQRVFAALRELFARLGARAPLVLAIDDLQWADADSLVLLEEILRPPDGPRLLLVATRRGPAGAAAALGEVAERRIHVAPLPAAEAEHLALRHLDEIGARGRAMAETVVREAAGHPLFIAELAQHLASGADQPIAAPGVAAEPRLDGMLRQRMGRLDEPMRRVLEAVVVAGVPIEQALVAEVTGLPYADLAARVASLRAGRFLRTSGPRPGDRAEPYHDRISESLRAGLAPEVVRAWHARLAAVLEPLPGASPDRLSIHLEGAGEPRRAAAFAVRAAEEATRALAFEHAARLYRRARDLLASLGAATSADELRVADVALAGALISAGRAREAAETYERVAASVPPREALDLRRRAGEAYLVSGEIDRGVATISALLAQLGMPEPERRDAMLLSVGLQRLKITLRGLGYRRREESEVDPALLLKLELGWSANMGLAFVDVLKSTWFQHRYIPDALRSGVPRHLIRAFVAEAAVSASRGAVAAARTAELLTRIEALVASDPSSQERGLYGTAAVLCGQLEGRYAHVVEVAEATILELERAGYSASWEMDTMRIMLLDSLFKSGRPRRLVERSEAYLRAARDRGDHYEATLLRTGVPNHAWLVRGDAAGARRAALDAAAGWSARGTLLHTYMDLMAQAAIDLYEDPEGDAAWRRVTAGWKALHRDFLLNFENGRVTCFDLRARATVAAARRAPAAQAAKLRKAAEGDVRRLRRQKQAPAAPLAAVIEAALCAQRGDAAGAFAALAAAERGFEAAEMLLHAQAARRQAGVLEGGSAGAARVAEVDTWLRGEGVADPARLARMLTPGFGE